MLFQLAVVHRRCLLVAQLRPGVCFEMVWTFKIPLGIFRLQEQNRENRELEI